MVIKMLLITKLFKFDVKSSLNASLQLERSCNFSCIQFIEILSCL